GEAGSAEAQTRLQAALEDGVLKIASKMGISTVDGYRGAQIFEALGLAAEVVDTCLVGAASAIGGRGFPDPGGDAPARHRAPVPVDEVEPALAITRRFSSGAMSHGSLSAEAHETLALALNMVGARNNCGEGGESRHRYRTRGTAQDRNSRIKQIASGRFGVTPEYCAFADELNIKMAQGSKPGEGGHLPGHKVSQEIADRKSVV